jgi:hypothetical protein
VAQRWSKTVIVCAGGGAFEPKRAIDARGVTDLEGRGVHDSRSASRISPQGLSSSAAA